MMKLIQPSMKYGRQIMAYRQAFLDAGGSMDGCGALRRFDRVEDWLEALKECPEGRVPSIQYLYLRESDKKIVGMLQLRPQLNEILEKYAGHIGYSVCPGERRKGYATRMLAAVLPRCKALGLERVLISCQPENEGSRRTILNNGGVYESTVYWPERDVYLERYWIDLSDSGQASERNHPE